MPYAPDFSQLVIYIISCKNADIKPVYIGSTTHLLKRQANHKDSCTNPNNKKYNLKIYNFIRENGGWDNWEVLEIEKYPCVSSEEATKRERYWYERFAERLNSNIPSRTVKQYYKDNSEKFIQMNRAYYQIHKEAINSKRNESFKCECGSCYTLRNKSTHFKTRFHIEKLKQL